MPPTTREQPFKVAILRNYSTNAAWGKDMVNSWYNIIHRFEPDAEVSVYHPIDGGELPVAAEHDLIILTGGTYNLLLDAIDPWVSKTLDFVKATVEKHPEVRILGICWGHQVVALALGGQLGKVKEEKCVGVQDVVLTEQGKSFFNPQFPTAESLRIHKFHQRRVVAIPPGFAALAENCEIYLSPNQKILGFQGHPEMTMLVASHILDADDGPYVAGHSHSEIADMYDSFKRPHDGAGIFARVLEWAKA